jgi:YD repeat-containing protein
LVPRTVAAIVLVVVLAAFSIQGQQGGTSIYVYDDNGRLIAVISPTGEAATYEYDAAGNFTRIRRFMASDLAMLAFTPRQGPINTPVTIYGTGFDQGVNSVSFNGVAAAIVSSTLTSVVALVPAGATTGPITVVTPRGTVTSTTSFVVRGILITPQSIIIPALEAVQFSVSVSGTPTNNVVWSVEGVNGGNSSVGTITSMGFYLAPNPSGSNGVPFTIRATSVDDSELFGEAFVTVVPFGAGSQFRSQGVSVRYGTPPNTPPTYLYGAASVRYGTPANNPPTYINGAVSVRYGAPANNSPTFVSGAVSASRGPVLTSLSPGTIARGATISLTINGVALNGANIKFYKLANGTPENGITISNINVNGPGTSLTANVTVASNVAVGSYVVVVTTATGSTTRNDSANNVVQIN